MLVAIETPFCDLFCESTVYSDARAQLIQYHCRRSHAYDTTPMTHSKKRTVWDIALLECGRLGSTRLLLQDTSMFQEQ